jgi:phosphonate transport system ATP-binding protein
MSLETRSLGGVPQEARPVSLQVENLGKSYGGRQTISEISFHVHAAEFVAVLGPSGAGKTTLFRCIAGLVTPTAGQIRVLGSNTSGPCRRKRRRIGVVFQQFNLIGRRSAVGNVLAGRLGQVPAWRGLLGRFSRQDQLWALECLDRVGMLDKAEQRADTLSGGQQQRVAIARAIAQRPDIILADEPVASLDPQTSQDVLDLLRGICRREGVAVVCSLHQIHLARAYADRIVGLADGRIVADVGTAAFDEAAFTRVYGPLAAGVMSADDQRSGVWMGACTEMGMVQKS